MSKGDRTLEVLCVGEALAVTYPPEDLVRSRRSRLVVQTGGAESNVALHLASQGVATAWASRVGDDPFGRKVTSDLERGGVDVAWVQTDDAHSTGMYLKDTRADGSTFMHYYRSGSAAAHMDAGDVARFPVARATWVHVSGITSAISPSAARMVDALVDACREHEVAVSFDVNFRPRLWSSEVAAAPLLTLAQRADLVLVGLDEADDLWGAASAADVFELVDVPSLVVVKDGASGATEIDRRGGASILTFEPTPPVDVVEVIGAGDAFAGGYLAGLLRGEAARARLRRGHDVAAWTIGSWDDVRPDYEAKPFAPTPAKETE